jgi:hypothetical protein
VIHVERSRSKGKIDPMQTAGLTTRAGDGPFCASTKGVANVKAVLAILLAFSGSTFAAVEPIVIPIEVVDGNNIATAQIGDSTIRVHIDTGGYKSIGVTPGALDRLPVRFTSAPSVRTDGAGAKYSGRSFVIPDMRLGGATFDDIPGFERKQAASGDFGGPQLFDAVLGRDFLVNHTVVVDYPNKRIELHALDAGPTVCKTPTASMIATPEGLWTSMMTTDHGQFVMVWDTGARGASFIQERLVGQRALPIRDDAYATSKFQLGQVDLGPAELVPIPLDGFPHVDGLIGINVFALHRVCFDFANRVVSVQ